MESNDFPYLFLNVVDTLGSRQDYFQGTGGNVSLKVNDAQMVIKSSGMRIKDMVTDTGVVTVAHTTISKYFYDDIDCAREAEGNAVIQQSVTTHTKMRPSIETGFHTLLHTAVIHSHSVYVNLLTCSSDFVFLVNKLFLGRGISYSVIVYATPGYFLTHKVKEALALTTRCPHVVFLKNHGVIVSADTLDDAIILHETVNEIVRTYFSLHTDYPRAQLRHIQDGVSQSATVYMKDFVQHNKDYFLHIQDCMLFPDLVVFCRDMLVLDTGDRLKKQAKIVVDLQEGTITYYTNNKEAHIIEENLVAWAYLLTEMKKHTLKPVFIGEQEARVLDELESEKYRKKLIQ
jgi:ribulose-5-phosphate 4-epimerase/fuculose-1-phosphate aldolase